MTIVTSKSEHSGTDFEPLSSSNKDESSPDQQDQDKLSKDSEEIG